jgi:hypothetical protein
MLLGLTVMDNSRDDDIVLACDVMYTRRQIPAFRGNILFSPSSILKMETVLVFLRNVGICLLT